MRILFDLDGTLTDSSLGITNCIQHALRTLGRSAPPAKDLRWCIGPPLQKSFLALLDTDDTVLAAEALELYRERYSKVGLFENEVYSDIPESLAILRERGYTLSVATAKPEIYSVRIIEHFGLEDYFHSVDGSQLDGTRTDKGDLIEHILERENLDKQEAIMIGDRKHDIIGASRNGLASVGVLWGYGTREELQAAGAGVLVENPNQIPDAIQATEYVEKSKF